MYDIGIIGGGTAGLTAAIYGQRAGKRTLVIEGLNCRFGQKSAVTDVDLNIGQGAFVGVIGRFTGSWLKLVPRRLRWASA